MDEAFANLEDISDEQTLERLESLFESTSSFPTLDSPLLHDEGTANGLFASLDPVQDLFGSFSTTSPSSPLRDTSIHSKCSSGSTSSVSLPVPIPVSIPSSLSFSKGHAPPSSTSCLVLSNKSISPSNHLLGSSSSSSSGILLSTTPTVLHSSSLVQGHPLQIQLQSNSNNGTSFKGSGAPLLPKNIGTEGMNSKFLSSVSSSPLLFNSLGQMLSATAVSTNSIFLSQSGSSNQVFVLRPSNSLTTSNTTGGGTYILQQSGGPLINAQPQVKIITPQGRMQMQQIQTPMGSKLIAVPVGQTLVSTSGGALLSPCSSSSSTVFSTNFSNASLQGSGQNGGGSPAAANVVVSLGPLSSSSSSSSSFSHLSPTTKKKIKERGKKRIKEDSSAEDFSPLKQRRVDLGELMKDAGLDLETENYPGDVVSSFESTNNSGLSTSHLDVSASSSSSSSTTLLASITAPLSLQMQQQQQHQTLQHLQQQQPQQQIMMTTTTAPGTSNQLQLVQGPDGQYVLQSTTLSTQPSAILSDQQSQTYGVSHVGAALLGTTQQQLHTSSALPIPSNSKNCPRTPNRSRSNQDPHRVPLYIDDRLPTGWHRKVSQRKSGASAGRYEVFIIGPTGKRFRSRNELKTFFKNSNQSDLDPEDFDFSTFGTGRTTSTNIGNSGNNTAATLYNTTTSSNNSSSSNNIGNCNEVKVLVAHSAPSESVSSSFSTSSSSSSHHNHSAKTLHLIPEGKLQAAISVETADADAQISQLIKTLQEEPSPPLSHPPTIKLVGDGNNILYQGSLGQFRGSEEPETKTSLCFLPSSKAPPIVQQVSRGEVFTSCSLPLGGASTQVRALQNLPQNTRLVRGPNGQYTIQKIQTIELSPEMQQSLKAVQCRIQEIERQTNKTPQDEAELATLQTKQQRILSMGKPVTSSYHPSSSLSPHSSLSSSQVLVQSPGCLQRSSSSNAPDNNIHSTLTSSVSKTTHPLTSSSSSHSVTQAIGNQGSSSTIKQGSSVTNIPPLTEQQKRIVAAFKQKMAQLPPEKQGQFIANNKALLLKQLNFQPSQLQILRSNHHHLSLSESQQSQQQLQLQQQQQQMQQCQQQQLQMQHLQQQQEQQLQLQQQQQIQKQQQLQPQTSSSESLRLLSNSENSEGKVGISLLKDGGCSHSKEKDGTSNEFSGMKEKKIAWVESQIKKDQHEALHPNIKVPFRSKEDACKRLLRYHVFNELDAHPKDILSEEESFSSLSTNLLTRYSAMRNKYHFLLLQESMRLKSSSEEVMLARLWDSDERALLKKQKEDFVSTGLLSSPLPPLPSSWSDKYKAFFGVEPSPSQISCSPSHSSYVFSSSASFSSSFQERRRRSKETNNTKGEEGEENKNEFYVKLSSELSRYQSVNESQLPEVPSSELFEEPPSKMMMMTTTTTTTTGTTTKGTSTSQICSLSQKRKKRKKKKTKKDKREKRKRKENSIQILKRSTPTILSSNIPHNGDISQDEDEEEDDDDFEEENFKGNESHDDDHEEEEDDDEDFYDHRDSVQSAINSILHTDNESSDISGFFDSFNDPYNEKESRATVSSLHLNS